MTLIFCKSVRSLFQGKKMLARKSLPNIIPCLISIIVTVICMKLITLITNKDDPTLCKGTRTNKQDENNETKNDLDLITQLDEDDPKLLQIIKTWFLEEPAGMDIPYNFSVKKPNLKGQTGQALEVDNILKQKRNGFFIECGAYDGEAYSNSLLFELERNWTGLLIEPNFLAWPELISKHRKAYLFNGCISGLKHPERINFVQAAMVSGLQRINPSHSVQDMRTGEFQLISKTTCFPLYSLLLALGNPTVDFFSLDVEGAEWEILQTIPWTKVKIDLLMVENAHLGDINPIMEEFMDKQGYNIAARLYGQDIIFQKRKH